MIMQICN